MAAYGFVASVLPVWMLLCPRDYLSSYMKIGTIGAARRRRHRGEPAHRRCPGQRGDANGTSTAAGRS